MVVATSVVLAEPLPERWGQFIDNHCASCHNDVDKKGGLDLTEVAFTPGELSQFQAWVKIHDRVAAGEMPPKAKVRPAASEVEPFLSELAGRLTEGEKVRIKTEGRTVARRLNRAEYENALRDLFQAPWLQIQGLLPEDGESHHFNKSADALGVSHVHMARYMAAADFAIRQVVSVAWVKPLTSTRRYYARDQRTLTSKFTQNPFNNSPHRQTYPLLGFDPQPEVRARRAALTVGETDPVLREQEAVGWVSSNYVTGFTYRWDQFRAPVAGRYRIRFSGYTMWAAPGGISRRFINDRDAVGKPRPPQNYLPDFDVLSRGRRSEPIVVYTRNGVMNRRVGEFDLTPEPGVYDIGDVWLMENETLVPDASRLFRSRPTNFRNPLMEEDGAPSVAFRWMEVEGPLYDAATNSGYALLFGDLPIRRAAKGGLVLSVVQNRQEEQNSNRRTNTSDALEEVAVEVVSQNPDADAKRLLSAFLERAYRRPVEERDLDRFHTLVSSQLKRGLSFTEAMIAGYTGILASSRFAFVEGPPGWLKPEEQATRLSLFLANSTPDTRLREKTMGMARLPENELMIETERLLSAPTIRRFVEAFTDHWLDLRKIEDSTPSTTLYNDYYLDDALLEAAVEETRLYFADLLQRDAPIRELVDARHTFLNERLAAHYKVPGVFGVQFRRVTLPEDSVRGGFLTQASVLKVTANGTTTSPVLRGKWIVERILGENLQPPPAVPAIEPDIRGAVTIRQQLEKHRADESCAACHKKIDPPGFALESFDVMGGWRDRYRAIDEAVESVPGLGKNGQPFAFHYALPVDASGETPDGRSFDDIIGYKKWLLRDERRLARNLLGHLITFATGAPVGFSDREHVERILDATKERGYPLRSLIRELVRSDLFRMK
ncbi:MAG TPA: DUF1588 domain-containing protein [Opitutaceae bacterium]|nr:DUF1588 domain-containing protein [Opitutaceae bacterium]